MKLNIKQIYLFYPVVLQSNSAIRRVIVHTDKHN